MTRLRWYQFAFVVAVISCTAINVGAQTVVYDWSSDSKAPESYPTITRRQTVTFQVTSINDILYTYRLQVTQTRLDTSDFDFIKALLTRVAPAPAPGAGPAANCSALDGAVATALVTATTAISNDPKLPEGYLASGSNESISLKASIDAWNSHAASIQNAKNAFMTLQSSGCPVTPQRNAEYTVFVTAVTNIQKKIDGPHIIEEKHELSPGHRVSVTVLELLGSKTIKTKTFTFDTADVLTLSAGAMFSRIQDRTYEARKDPTSSLNTLTVEGNSKATPSLIALLNYNLGAIHLDSERFGLALSAGPVLRVGSQSESSSFGFFTGLSGHLYRRFYVTPGFHFGQFADFPVGFANGSSVPANFGELTPVKRWTARFGLAISFKTNSFDGFISSDKKISGGETASKPNSNSNGGDSARSFAGSLDNLTALRFLRSGVPPPLASPIATSAVMPSESNSSSFTPPQPAIPKSPEPVFVSAPRSAASFIHVSSLIATRRVNGDERISLETSVAVRDYSMYFKNGRFYLVLPRARLGIFQDGLQGDSFSEAMVEKRGEDLLLSFVLRSGMGTRIIERSSGIDLVFTSTSHTQD